MTSMEMYRAEFVRRVYAQRRMQPRVVEEPMLAESRRQANEAIRRANEAARQFNGETAEAARIIRRICRATGVSRREVLSIGREAHVAFARHACCYWLWRLTGYSLPKIGRILGGRDHTTILHGKTAYVEKRARMGRTLREVR